MGSNGKRVLVTDDEKDLREAIVTALTYEGFETISAGDGEEGLSTALREKPDLIFLDLMMPKLDGVGMLKELRTDTWGKTVPVIIMTALDDLEKIAEVLEEGGTEYLVKSSITLETIVKKAKTRLGVM